MTHNTNERNEPKQDNVLIEEEIAEPSEIDVENIKQETIISKRPYYQCITCSATFTKAEKLKGHASIHKGKKFTKIHNSITYLKLKWINYKLTIILCPYILTLILPEVKKQTLLAWSQ